MWEKLEEVFIELGLPYSRQGSYAETETLPDSFFTFWNYSTPNLMLYDNVPNCKLYVWYIYFYTNDASLIYSKLDEFILLARNNGFIVDGNGEDLQSDVPDYFGRFVKVQYRADNNE